MPSVALVATQLTDHAARKWTITMGGIDVSRQPGDGGNHFGVPVESVLVREEGPGGVSSMEFAIEDPGKDIAIGEQVPVEFWDRSGNTLIFKGEVDHYSSEPDFGGQGRTYFVSCIGVEAWLDRVKLATAYVSGAADNLNSAIVGLVTSLGTPIRAVSGTTNNNGNFLEPVGELGRTFDVERFPFMQGAITIAAGTSLRSAIQALASGAAYVPIGYPNQPADILFTVDYFMGLRVWLDVLGEAPSDWNAMDVVDAVGFVDPAAAYLQREQDWGDLVREVYVVGGNAAGSGWFGDGSGLHSDQQLVNDSSSLTEEDARLVAATFFANQASARRTTLSLEAFDPGGGAFHAGGLLNLTDAATAATGQYRIASIDKRFNNGGSEEWTVHLGAFAPSSARLLGGIARREG